MEKQKITKILWGFLLTISLSAYIYLHNTAVEEYGVSPSSVTFDQQNENGINMQRESQVLLPDLSVVKKILNITKVVLPSE